MIKTFKINKLAAFSAALLALSACATTGTTTSQNAASGVSAEKKLNPQFERDRQAILAMTGDYKVTFDFLETVSFVEGYEPKDRYVSGAHEVVRVIEDRGNFISLQHILVVGGEEKFPVKHWRQDWLYEPEQVLVFIGGNAWEQRPVPVKDRKGKWAQIVYQVDDSPRYGAVGAWSHENGVSEWAPPAEWRPLPRRDMTKRDDYHAVNAVNRHAITPWGWVHEQDNSKIVLSGEPQTLVREIGVNTYVRNDDFDIDIADDYWAETEDYWAAVREAWTRVETENPQFGLTLKGEPEDLYMPLLELASDVQDGKKTVSEAEVEAKSVIEKYTTPDLDDLNSRLREPALMKQAAVK